MLNSSFPLFADGAKWPFGDIYEDDLPFSYAQQSHFLIRVMETRETQAEDFHSLKWFRCFPNKYTVSTQDFYISE